MMLEIDIDKIGVAVKERLFALLSERYFIYYAAARVFADQPAYNVQLGGNFEEIDTHGVKVSTLTFEPLARDYRKMIDILGINSGATVFIKAPYLDFDISFDPKTGKGRQVKIDDYGATSSYGYLTYNLRMSLLFDRDKTTKKKGEEAVQLLF